MKAQDHIALKIKNFTQTTPQLKKWFLEQKRDLPWRDDISPYAIWVSEVMLQQTQVSVVIPYFNRWMIRFPTIEDLATATLDEVIKMWEGLGYYSRARNLHQGAQYVVKFFRGHLPKDPEELKKIKGLGPYTIGAIRSFAFKERAAAVDGNVVRVLTRFFGIQDDIAKSKTMRNLWTIAEQILPHEEPWIVNEALIELGATVCQRNAQCAKCPLNKRCESFSSGLANDIPVKSRSYTIEHIHRAVALIVSDNHLLIKRGSAGEIMSDLHEFPYFQMQESQISPQTIAQQLKKDLKIEAQYKMPLATISHSFTRYAAKLYPFVFIATSRFAIKEFKWLPIEELNHLAFSSGHRRLFEAWKSSSALF